MACVKLDSNALQKIDLIKEKAALFKVEGHEWIHCGKWIRSGIVHYVDPTGKRNTYEMVERTTRPQLAGVDGVDVIALGSPDSGGDEKRIVLVMVYRPPVEKFSVEFPAGLVDPGESLLQAARRELEEETGYSGNIKFVSPALHIDPSKSNENSAMCTAEVPNAEERSGLKLDSDEYLEVLELPMRDLRQQLDLLQKEHGFVVDARLYCFAMGLEMAGRPMSKVSI